MTGSQLYVGPDMSAVNADRIHSCINVYYRQYAHPVVGVTAAKTGVCIRSQFGLCMRNPDMLSE